MFRWIDRKLLGAAQWVCDTAQQLTGVVTKFKFQKWAEIMFVLFLWAADLAIFNIVFTFANLGNTVITVFNIRKVEKEEAEFLAGGGIKFNIFNHASERIVLFCIMGITNAVVIFLMVVFRRHLLVQMVFGSLFMANSNMLLWGYFSACIPRPPCKSKVREWCKKGLQWLKDQKPESEPVPEPA